MSELTSPLKVFVQEIVHAEIAKAFAKRDQDEAWTSSSIPARHGQIWTESENARITDSFSNFIRSQAKLSQRKERAIVMKLIKILEEMS
jgi:hypothetical protein